MLNVITFTASDEDGKVREKSILVSFDDMVNRKRSFTMLDEDGYETEYHVLFSFENSETDRTYLVYTDETVDEEGRVEVYASIYSSKDGEEYLSPVETEEEWAVIEVLLEEMKNRSRGE